MWDWISNGFFTVFSGFGLVGLVTLGLFYLATRLRETPWAWALAIVLGCVGAYATEFAAEIATMNVLGLIPFQPWPVLFWGAIAFSCLFVSANAKASRWPIAIPCAIVTVLALQYGVRTGEEASLYAAIATVLVGVLCFFGVPQGLFKLSEEGA